MVGEGRDGKEGGRDELVMEVRGILAKWPHP